MGDKIEYHIKRIEGALKRRVRGINHQVEYLERLTKKINEEKNSFIKQDKLNRYCKEEEGLKKMKDELDLFINIKVPNYLKRNKVDYSIHMIKTI
ncbi:hypothetical protein [Clostridium perfringens]|uniref:hypothetical protein n=1 Tax=Clostridium perfringens TaxID=1502 RepID=UPI00189A536B|nr:hypothetical protein [Clostridium perfringens]